MKKWVIKSGIQRKYLRYIMGLLLLAILLSSIGVWIYVRQSLTTEVTDKLIREQSVSGQRKKQLTIY